MSIAEREPQPQQIPERHGALSFIGWVQVTGTICALLVVGAVLRLIGPYVGWWAPLITDALAVMLITCIFAAPIALVLHFWHKNGRENFRSRLVRPTSENAYPAYWDSQTFQQPTALPPPMKVPTHLNFAPTIQQRNDTALIRMLREMVYNQTTYVKPEQPPELDMPALPSYVEYDAIRHLIPRGHALVGVSGEGIETKDDYIRALLWIVGASGAGKTNSTIIRVDDDVRRGHLLLGVDPHAVKPDSLTKALMSYAPYFKMPIAHNLEDIDVVLDTFLEEFYGRRDEGWPLFPPLTLVVDEVDTLTVGIQREEKLAVRVMEKLKKIARICGQESRDFNLVSIFISHKGTGLAWLRSEALMVIAHQVLQFSERLVVCNQDREMARNMDNWPKGRSLVYGIAFLEGPRLVQQPVVKTRVIDATVRMPDLPPRSTLRDDRSGDEAQREANASTNVAPLFRASTEEKISGSKTEKEKVSEETKRIIVRLAKDMPLRQVCKYVGLGSEKYPIFKQVCEELGIQPKEVVTPTEYQLPPHPRDTHRAALSNEVALGRLPCCCAFCEEGVVPLCRQQASAVTKMVPEAAMYYTAYLLSARCASRGPHEEV